MVSRDFGIPASAGWLVTRGMGRTGRSLVRRSARPRPEQSLLEAAELLGIVSEVARFTDRLTRLRQRPGQTRRLVYWPDRARQPMGRAGQSPVRGRMR